jgi:hypothetical protein
MAGGDAFGTRGEGLCVTVRRQPGANRAGTTSRQTPPPELESLTVLPNTQK